MKKTTIAFLISYLAAGLAYSWPTGPYAMNPNPGIAHSTGAKSVLIIRVQFPDVPANKTFAQVETVMSQVKQRYLNSSYGKLVVTPTVTQALYMMPHPSAYYALQRTQQAAYSALMDDAILLASRDYQVDQAGGVYDFVGYYSAAIPKVPGIKCGGNFGSFGSKFFWINGAMNSGVVCHEMGHALGADHANYWKTSDGNPVSAIGKSIEYGDTFDIMAHASSVYADFNPWRKNSLGWIADDQVAVVASPSTVTLRIYRFDHPLAIGLLAVKIPRGDGSYYWVSIRRSWTIKSAEMTGAYVIWGYDFLSRQSNLIDCNSPGVSADDSALQVGQTLTDSAYGISITPLAIGGISPNEWMDVWVTKN